MNTKKRLEEFNKKYAPLSIMDSEETGFTLCLTQNDLSWHEEAFDLYGEKSGDPKYDIYGLKNHGNGYEWDAAFREAFIKEPALKLVSFDSEAGGFYCTCTDLFVLIDFAQRFYEICKDTERFVELISDGVERDHKFPYMHGKDYHLFF